MTKKYGEAVWGTVTEANPVVPTTHGKIRGENRDGVAIFRGIPYGDDCDGEYRFLPPRPAKDWDGVKDCTKNGPYAMQFGTSISGSEGFGDYFSGGQPELFGVADEVQSENCLVLDVLTPGIDEAKRPVVVYIHGGGYMSGSGTLVIGSDKFVREEDIVVVGINHRLNIFGYLYLGAYDEKYKQSGMAGMLDLVLALEWVRDNIAAFGGDPDKVTIMGESGGCSKVTHLQAMPIAKGLFRAAICESGSGKVATNSREAAAKTAAKVLDALGIAEENWQEILKVPAEDLLNAMKCLDARGGFSAVPDDICLKYRGEDSVFVTEESDEVALLVGASEDEMGAFAGPELDTITEENLKERLIGGRDLRGGSNCTEENIDAVLKAIADIDEKHGKPAKTPEHIWLEAMSLGGFLGGGAYYHALDKASRGKAPAFYYMVSYDAPHATAPGRKYAWHTADLPLQFRVVRHPESEQVSKNMAHSWAAFIRTGDPSTEELPWPAFTAEEPNCMVIDEKMQIELDPYKALREAFE